jgi:hypothetical protein
MDMKNDHQFYQNEQKTLMTQPPSTPSQNLTKTAPKNNSIFHQPRSLFHRTTQRFSQALASLPSLRTTRSYSTGMSARHRRQGLCRQHHRRRRRADDASTIVRRLGHGESVNVVCGGFGRLAAAARRSFRHDHPIPVDV